jgi:large subunit ribosomal protein L9
MLCAREHLFYTEGALVKVLFKKDVADVARAGQVKDVADGYARNYLIPRGLAVVANAAALRQVAEVQASAARRASEEEEAARELKVRLESQPIVLQAKAGSTGRLYGSITTADVVTAVKKQLGADLDRRDVDIAEPVRQLGTHIVAARLHKSVTANLSIEVRAVGGAA